jgi:hypothetical protein
MSKPYNIYYNNRTGRVDIQKNNYYKEPCKKNINNPFQYKINELTKYANINSPNKVNIENNNVKEIVAQQNNVKEMVVSENNIKENNVNNTVVKKNNFNDIVFKQNNVKETFAQQNNFNDIVFKQNNVKETFAQQNNVKEIFSQQNNINETVFKKNNFNDTVIPENNFKEIIVPIPENNIKSYQPQKNYLQETTIQQNKYNDQLKNDIKIHLEKINIFKQNEENEKNDIKIHLDNINILKNEDNCNGNSNGKTNLTYGIKKTILSDFNHLYNSSHCSDFRIGINNNDIFDVFYLFPNISEINTKTGTNIINEKKINRYNNMNNICDSQYFPIDFVACGITIPLKSNNVLYSKIIIKNIFWNIYQSINNSNFKNNELLGIVPEITDFVYKKIKLQINFELHAQVSENVIQKYGNEILPYRNKNIIKKITPANTCLYKVLGFNIDKIDGSNFNNIEINLLQDINIQCALLCIKISVPDDSIRILKGSDKINNKMYGHIPFSQFILNFDYEII